ncbi:hypothetical protein ACP70R_029165 [Stipagrostis hirtigluma subsp. patula]
MASSTRGQCFLLALFILFSAAYAQLSETYYASMCPSLDLRGIVRDELNRVLPSDPRMGASLLRLFFHDCFVQGCDASVLLDDDAKASPRIDSEKNASPNRNSLRGFEVIDRIKTAVEAKCSRAVSCADILAVAAREAVVALGGQGWGWTVRLGRRDSTTANRGQAETDLPSPGSSNSTLIAAFAKKNFTPSELVALSGAHTIGLTQCHYKVSGLMPRNL